MRLLPSTVQLEHSNYDFLFQSTAVRNFARYSPRVLEPEPGARDQWQLLLELVGRMNAMSVEHLDQLRSTVSRNGLPTRYPIAMWPG